LLPFGFLGEVSIAADEATNIGATVFANPALKNILIDVYA